MKAAEVLRSREVYLYYQPRVQSESNAESSTSLKVPGAHFSSTNFTTQQSFSDTALTAFTQLIALRLGCQRAIVSLSDHENEYFLAESTSTFGIIGDNGPAQNAWLSISGARVPRKASLCEQTLCLVPNQDTTAEMTPVYLVPDLRLDEKMCDLECVKRWDLRFYCGVALTNGRGVNIGCVYVVDDKPRTDFTLEQAQFLTRMAATVMDHLENIRAKEDVVRVTMMSQALHAFIEGDGTMSGDWQRLKRSNLPSGAGVGFHWETNKDDGTGSYSNGKKELGRSNIKAGIEESRAQVVELHDAKFNSNHSPWSSTSEIPQALPLKSVFDVLNESNVSTTADPEFTSAGFSGLLRSTFSRASNLVREGMEVDGAVYFDAPYRFYEGRSTLETDVRIDTDVHDGNSSDDEILEIKPGPSLPTIKKQPAAQISMGRLLSARNDVPGLKSEVLGYSTKESSSWNNETADKSFTAIEQSLLSSLVRRYSQGELFVYDEEGPISPHTAAQKAARKNGRALDTVELKGKKERRKVRKRAEIMRLLESFPGARQIFFVPLYDSTSGCFIGSFAWSTSATRIFSLENHHSYLIAFGHSVMSEVSRLNTLSADRAKGDFISNVSHELRSPLHGILASVEFLADSTLDGFQRNLVDTIDICGRTLLDTIEHVLDFNKIKKFGQEIMQPMGVVADIDISAVVEEVLEGVFAGFEFNGLSSQGLADTTQSHTYDAAHVMSPSSEGLRTGYTNTNDQLSVILDIDFREKWKFPTVPGIFRRITMNIFGNALKYTAEGYIKIKLEARNIPVGLSRDGIEKTMITLTISDTGRGIDPHFMKTKLFMPFSQETPTSPGTGLGMSIVKQIVDLSGGRIDIQSEVGKGTEVKLSIPLTNINDQAVPSKLALNDNEDPIEALRRRALGRTVTIRGFDYVFEDSDLRITTLESLKASIEKYVTEWFGLTIVADDHPADIVISDENAFLSAATDEHNRFRSQLILCSNGARRNIYMSRLQHGQAVEFVSKPCGPHRMAKALLNCLDTEDAMKTNMDRVSHDPKRLFDEHDATETFVPAADAKMTAGTSGNRRLIGDLQTSIGFSPKTTDFVADELKFINRRLPMRMSSSTYIAPQVDKSNDGSSAASHGISEDISTVGTAETSTTVDFPTKSTPAPSKVALNPKMLLVEDNPVNMMLLATYMKKNGWAHEKAENGLLALQAFSIRPAGFDVIFMDVGMPIMTGYESTRAIRKLEAVRRTAYELQQQQQRGHSTTSSASSLLYSPGLSPSALLSTSFPFNASPLEAMRSETIGQRLNPEELKLNAPALIIALTGFSSKEDQEQAFEAGVDVFMTKPVRFREVGKILDGWMKTREMDLEAAEFVE